MTERDDELEMDGAAHDLIASARRGRMELSEDAAQDVLARVMAETRERKRRWRGAPGALWLSGLAAGLALLGTLTGPWSERETTAPGVVVKHMSFESVHDGKVTRLEITVYRTERKENDDVTNPQI
jgi:hypothetical protein